MAKKTSKKPVFTRKDEMRYPTLIPEQMLNKFIAEDVYKKWKEEFTDTETGKKRSFERTQKLYSKGTYITNALLSKIQFDIQSGEITEPIYVSNQNRKAEEEKHSVFVPWSAKISVNDHTVKFLLYAQSVDAALLILKDFVELNYTGGFTITELKEFTQCIILEDNLSQKDSEDDIAMKYLRNEIDWVTYMNATAINAEDVPSDEGKKFYQMDINVKSTDVDNNEEAEYSQQFIVHTYDTERAMMIIRAWLKSKDEEVKEKDGKHPLHNYHLIIEKAAPIPVTKFIPAEFSKAYLEE